MQTLSAPPARKLGAPCDRVQQRLIINRLFEEIYG
jgi:hypothetical protein